ncbi:hypothetical protein Tco_1383183 [Tanacetum coccineum]
MSTISQEYLLEFTSEYGIAEDLHPELRGPGDRIVDFLEGKVGVYTKFFEFANFRIPISQFLFDILGHYQIHLSQLSVIGAAKKNILTVPFERRYGFVQFDPTEDQAQRIMASEVPPLENVTTTGIAPETDLGEEVATMGLRVIKKRRKMGNDVADANAPPKVLRKDHVVSRPTQSTVGGKSLASVGLETGPTFPVPAPQETPTDASDPDPLSYANPQSIPERDVAQSSKGVVVAEDPESENTSFTSMDLVDHLAPPSYFSELRHLPNDDFLGQYNIILARQVAMGSQLRLRFEQEAKLLKKFVAQVARRDQRIQARENEIKNLEALLEAETDMKKAAEANNVTGEERIKEAFKEFKKYEDDRVSSRCVEMDARLDALSIDFDEELYLHMLTAIAGRWWVIGHGLRLAVLKCAESLELRQVFANVVSTGIAKGFCDGLKYGVEQGEVELDLANIKAYDPKANDKFMATMQVLKDLKYPLIDELEKDAPMDIIMATLYLKRDTGEDAPQWISDLRLSSSQLKIPVYPEVRDSKYPWAVKEEMLLEDTITANKSRAEKKRKCRIIFHTHGVGSAHHARSDLVPMSAPTVIPQGLQILLKDTAALSHQRTDHLPDLLDPSRCLLCIIWIGLEP